MNGLTANTAAAVAAEQARAARDPALRRLYASNALAAIPRILAAVDRNPFGPTYGCCDREYWHYRTAAFPSEMYQEAALPLALAYRHALPGGSWQGDARLAEAAVAVLRFSARSAHADGSGDDYYPHERALGATVFSLQAAVEAYRLLDLDDSVLRKFFLLRARWIARHDEAGRLTNHHALAALAMWRTGTVCDDAALRYAAVERVRQIIAWQSPEGWWPEYDGADPGYQTATIDCLAKLQQEAGLDGLDEPLRRGVEFCAWFQHLDDGYGGEYGSRGTRHFYAHGMELLARRFPDAVRLAEGYLRSLSAGTAARWDDDRMYVHHIGNLIEAYLDWSPLVAPTETPLDARTSDERYFPAAGLFTARDDRRQLIASAARGGGFFYGRRNEEGSAVLIDAGLVVELADGRIAVSQTHDLRRTFALQRASLGDDDGETTELIVAGTLHFVRFERATPLKQALLHFLAGALGAAGRGLLRRLLQRRVIHARREAPVRLTRTFRRMQSGWEVEDVVELTTPRIAVRRLAFASDLQAAYTAASNVYHDSFRQPWHDLAQYIDELNRRRRVTVVRSLDAAAFLRPRPAAMVGS